jgi:hypothetical protein
VLIGILWLLFGRDLIRANCDYNGLTEFHLVALCVRWRVRLIRWDDNYRDGAMYLLQGALFYTVRRILELGCLCFTGLMRIDCR